MVEQDLEHKQINKIKLTGVGRQISKRQNSWQQVKHSKPYADLLQAFKRELLISPDSQQRDHNFCVRGIPPRVWKRKTIKDNALQAKTKSSSNYA